MVKTYDPLAGPELNNDANFFLAGAAGIASGLIKVPEGVFSLAAELLDLGAGTDVAVDVEKFFDQINRPLVLLIARRMGMPLKGPSDILCFQQSIITHNTISTELGIAYRTEVSIIQGDPLSMRMSAILMRPWVVMMRERGVHPSLYVDDLMILASGEDMLFKFSTAMNDTHEYLEDMGAGVSADK